DAGGAAAGERGRSGAAAKAIGRTAEVIDKGEVPVVQEIAGDANPRAARIHAAVEILRRGAGSIRVEVVPAGIQVQSPGQAYAVAVIGRTDRRSVGSRHLDERRGRRWRRLVRHSR